MNSPIESIPLDSVTPGARRRLDNGDIAGLAESIQKWGLLHPLIVDDDNRLIAGGRRLEALKRLGFLDVPVRRWGSLTDDERRELELEENLQRKDLTPIERSRNLVQFAEVAATSLKQQTPSPDFQPDSGKKSARGRPSKPDAETRVAERIGVPQQTISDARRHVETAEAYSFMEDPSWKQYHVLEAREKLAKLPEAERPEAAKLIDQPGIPPKTGVKLLSNLAEMPDDKRRQVFALNESPDIRDQKLALTEAAHQPPLPDPRRSRIDKAISELQHATRPFPHDPLTPRIGSIITELRAIARAIKEQTSNGSLNANEARETA